MLQLYNTTMYRSALQQTLVEVLTIQSATTGDNAKKKHLHAVSQSLHIVHRSMKSNRTDYPLTYNIY